MLGPVPLVLTLGGTLIWELSFEARLHFAAYRQKLKKLKNFALATLKN